MGTEGEARLANGCCLHWRPNGAGGRTYYSDEIDGGVSVWDTSAVDESTLLAAIIVEHEIQREEQHAARKPPKVEFTLFSVAGKGIWPRAIARRDIVSVLEEIHVHKGWESMAAMREEILGWSKKAKPGDCFKTKFSLIVAVEG